MESYFRGVAAPKTREVSAPELSLSGNDLLVAVLRDHRMHNLRDSDQRFPLKPITSFLPTRSAVFLRSRSPISAKPITVQMFGSVEIADRNRKLFSPLVRRRWRNRPVSLPLVGGGHSGQKEEFMRRIVELLRYHFDKQLG